MLIEKGNEKKVNIQNVLPRYSLPSKYLSTIEKSPNTERQYLGQPDMIRTKTGRLITVYPIGHGKGPLVMKISEDNGDTWVEKKDIPESWARSQETPTMYVLHLESGQERLLLITGCPGWGDGTTGWNTSYSDDNGETWTEYAHWYTTLSDGSTNNVVVAMSSLVQLKDKNGKFLPKWMGTYQNYEFINLKTYLTFDENGNEQWSEPVPLLSQYREIEKERQMCEIGMFRSPDGKRIVALVRSQSHQHLSTMIYSDDEGETWSKPVELTGSLAGERHKAFYDPISGKLLVVFREIKYDINKDGIITSGDWMCGDWGMWVGTYEQLMNLEDGEYSVTLAKDWTQSTYSGDTGYSGVVVLEDGTIILDSYGHWDKEFSEQHGFGNVTTDLCYIKQAKFKLADLEKEIIK